MWPISLAELTCSVDCVALLGVVIVVSSAQPAPGDSISFSLGSEFIQHTDFSLPGPFPIEWERIYHSRLAEYDQGSLGARWVTEFTTRIDIVGKGVLFHDFDGRSHAFELPKVGKALFNAIEDLLLVRSTDSELVICRGFVRKEYYLRVGDRYYLRKILLENDAGCMLHYELRHACATPLLTTRA